MIQGGWICRACWKSNRPDDDRCYRCKTPRDQQIDVAPGSLKEQTEPGHKLRGRWDSELPLLAALVSWPMWLSGWIGIIFGVLSGLLALLAVIGGREANAIVSMIAAAFLVVLGWLFVFLARSVRRGARWAYAIAAVGYLLPSAPALLGLVEIPQGVALPDWYPTAQTIYTIVYVLLGLCAVFLFITSFIKRGDDETAATPEAG